MLAFVFGDYLSQILPFGHYAQSFYAALSIAALTAMNLMGTGKGTRTQNLLTTFKVIGLVSVVMVGMIASPSPSPKVPIDPTPGSSFGLAMVFVLLTFGGWNEAAYISAELYDVRRTWFEHYCGESESSQ
jgi:amino acid transporter